jgi:hypothetical protein
MTNVTILNEFDQELNTTSNVTFNKVSVKSADGTADPLFEVMTSGTNEYGWQAGTLDWTGFGVGYLPTLSARSNGGVDYVGVLESALVIPNYHVGDSGQFILFYEYVDDKTITLFPNWDWDGLGTWRLECDTEFYAGVLRGNTMQSFNFIVGDDTQASPYMTFDGLDSDAYLYYDSQNYRFNFTEDIAVAGNVTTDYIKTDSNEFLASDIIRHTVTAGEAAASVFIEAWNKTTQAKIADMHAITLDVSPNPDVVIADDWNIFDIGLKYNGTTITATNIVGATWNANDTVTIHIVYEK